jgi:tryptophan-rich sensory protein
MLESSETTNWTPVQHIMNAKLPSGVQALTTPTAICALALAAETVLAGRHPALGLRSLKQPPWAPRTLVWYTVGIVYYAACFLAVYRIAQRGSSVRSPAFWLLVAVMASNAAWNWLFFRRRDLRLSFFFFIPYSALVAAFLFTLVRHGDWLPTALWAIYTLYLPYALAWGFRVWKLNA